MYYNVCIINHIKSDKRNHYELDPLLEKIDKLFIVEVIGGLLEARRPNKKAIFHQITWPNSNL